MLDWLKKVVGVGDPISAVSGAVTEVTKDVTAVISTEKTRLDIDQRDLASAREADKPSGSNDKFNLFVDGFNRLQRPAWGIYFFGGVSGFWNFPNLTKIDPVWATYLTLYLTFLFGGRAILQDVPKGIAAAMKVWRS